jgi:CRISPR/Cas system-associated exonuclease Cas4 (RecB family)
MKASALKRLKDTYKSQDLILPALQRHVMRSIGDNPERSASRMHPSDMSHKEWCGRHDYYRMVGTPVERESQANPSFRMENLFAEGHTIHRKYQTWLWEMGVLYGWWLCHACGHRWEGLSPLYCSVCNSPRLEYKEVPLARSGYLIEGHSDGAVHGLEGFTGLIEIKSIGLGTLRFEAPRLYNRYQDGNETLENLWWKINRPFNSHIRQGMLYLWMAWPRYDSIVFIYESKFNQSTKEFVVGYNPTLIAPLLETAKGVTIAVETGIEPPRPDWAEGPDGKVCGSCSYRRMCWGIPDEVNGQAQESPASAVTVTRTTAVRRRKQLGATS